MYLGHLLAGGGPNDSPRALDEESVERDGSCKEEGVEGGRVEPFTDEGRGADDEHAVAALDLAEFLDDGSAFLRRHSALEHEGPVPVLSQEGGERLDVCDPAGEHEHVAAASERRVNVRDDLVVAFGVSGQGSVDAGEGAGRCQVDVVGTEGGLVQVQDTAWGDVLHPHLLQGAWGTGVFFTVWSYTAAARW
ncbi:MAG TPA: hypothetical protein VI248_01245 [Kineosporiaceae bacterium]